MDKAYITIVFVCDGNAQLNLYVVWTVELHRFLGKQML